MEQVKEEIVGLAKAQQQTTENQQLSGLGVQAGAMADITTQQNAILNGTDNKAKMDLFRKNGINTSRNKERIRFYLFYRN